MDVYWETKISFLCGVIELKKGTTTEKYKKILFYFFLKAQNFLCRIQKERERDGMGEEKMKGSLADYRFAINLVRLKR
jgi:hypothetical protein